MREADSQEFSWIGGSWVTDDGPTDRLSQPQSGKTMAAFAREELVREGKMRGKWVAREVSDFVPHRVPPRLASLAGEQLAIHFIRRRDGVFVRRMSPRRRRMRHGSWRSTPARHDPRGRGKTQGDAGQRDGRHVESFEDQMQSQGEDDLRQGDHGDARWIARGE